MFKHIFMTLFFGLTVIMCHGQGLYMPRDVKKAYTDGTRSTSGQPGTKYWQNGGRYEITVTALPPSRMISGTEKIVYYNNSPDTLKRLNIKLIGNIHKPGAPRSAGVARDYLTDGITVDKFLANGDQIAFDSESAFTNKMVSLKRALLPKDSVRLDIDWHYNISLQSNREGMIDSTTFFLAYFYPRIAVYDDYNGWDKLDFMDGAEFYNDFNDYVLHVKVPKNYMVWATGTLVNPDEVLQKRYQDRLNLSLHSDSTIHIVTEEDLKTSNITAPNAVNTWTWLANDISDMAVGLSDHYIWDGASVVVDATSKRRVSMQAAYNDKAIDYHQAVQLGLHSLAWLSEKLPGIPYPYPKMTSFQGFADQEYPMMCNDNADDPRFTQQFTQDHEIAHSYFPFYMGTNESRYAFMDEGWATALEFLMGRDETGEKISSTLFKNFRVKPYISNLSTSMDLPVITPTSELSASPNGGQGYNAYTKPALSYLALKDMLGEQSFKKALHAYMYAWHGKHPIPWDYFYSMSKGAGRNLDWFFNNWFFSNNYIDLSAKALQKRRNGYQLKIANKGGFSIPFNIVAIYNDSSVEVLHQTPLVWFENQNQIEITIKTGKILQSIFLDTGIFVDADPSDNKLSL
ncbi:M1 family metallopeptidase [Mucilaginibacter sp.]|jgi:hypothetical protein|uniref:M1 family metallopeptidase n=1 Tax=Mucilaginibacter sp. TaxID=1882438 RepID=UPI003562776D